MSHGDKPLVLIILDGWGYSETHTGNAITQAQTPHWNKLWSDCPHALLEASGEVVGLPAGQMGNSEVGHLHIGSGRLVPQDLTRIESAIEDGSFFDNAVLNEAIQHSAQNQRALHLIGLVSPGGVHSHVRHLQALIRSAYEHGCPRVCIHAILDGRDMPPKSAQASLDAVESTLKQYPCGEIVSLMGRYYAMDRDKRWDRTQKAYDLMTLGKGEYTAENVSEALQKAYDRGETDEFVAPTQIQCDHQAAIEDNDNVIFFNFRADRARQLSYALWQRDFDQFHRQKAPKLAHFVTMTEYDVKLDCPVAFPSEQMQHLLGEVISEAGLKQLRLTETEKYAHVTFFFNGGQETAYDNEERALIPSPKVSTYDKEPGMSAAAITDELIRVIKAKQHDFIVVNYANADMVGHTGDFEATVQAIEDLDSLFGRIVEACGEYGGELLITADHGNAEKMRDPQTEQAHTAHTSALVPLIYFGRQAHMTKDNGSLIDIAPTVLKLLNLNIPQEMSGTPLVELEGQ